MQVNLPEAHTGSTFGTFFKGLVKLRERVRTGRFTPVTSSS